MTSEVGWEVAPFSTILWLDGAFCTYSYCYKFGLDVDVGYGLLLLLGERVGTTQNCCYWFYFAGLFLVGVFLDR